MYGYIYITTNTINGKRYIGQKSGAWNPEYKGSGLLLKQALKKHGKDNFTVKLLEYAKDELELTKKEIEWIAKYQAVNDEMFYNIGVGGKCWNRGLKNPKNSERMKINNPMYIQETREKMAASKRGKEAYNKIKDTFIWKCKWCDKSHESRNTKKLRDAANFCNKSCATSHHNTYVRCKKD